MGAGRAGPNRRQFADPGQHPFRRDIVGNGGFAYVWPLSTQFRVQNSLTRIHPAVYAPTLRQFSDEARSRYWSQTGGGYRSGVGGSTTRFYDDNAHMAVALMEAYRITGDPVYLARARETCEFVLSGEDSTGGGGIYFHQHDFSVKETISTLLETLHANRRDPNGHYGTLWGRGGTQATALSSWHLNDQAAVARAFLHTGLSLVEPVDRLSLELSRSEPANPFPLKLSGPSGSSGQIQISDDLRTWLDWLAFSLGDLPLEITDPGAGSDDTRFYRAVGL